MKTVTVTIDEGGNVTVEADGFQGKGCVDVVEKFTKALGVAVKSRNKPAYYNEIEGIKQKVYNS